jgi:outer membrane lipoprotein
MTRFIFPLLTGLAATMLCACITTPPFPRDRLVQVDPALTPEQAVQEHITDRQVLWGGVIIESINLSEQTVFTVLNYPLDTSQRPNTAKTPANRFKVHYPGYLETMVYAPGREITVLGNLQASEDDKVGSAPYRFAVVKADRVYLWPLRSNDSRVHFGIGVGVGVGIH